MATKTIPTWQRVIGYVAFAVVALIASFFLTFPYDALSDRVKMEADAAGYYLRIGSMGPGFFSIRAKNVQVSKKAAANAETPPEALQIDSISVGPTLFPPGIKVGASLLGGSASARVSGVSNINLKANLDELNLAQGNVKGFSGIDFAGEIDAAIEMQIPKVAVGSGPAEPDFSAANGTISINTRGLTVNGGTATVSIPMYGPEPTPLDLPKIVVGDLSGKVKIEKGLGTVDEFKSKSADLEIGATGTLKLAKRFEYSEPNLEIRFKPDAEFQKRLGLIGSALSMVGADPKDPTWRMGKLTGMLGRPNFR